MLQIKRNKKIVIKKLIEDKDLVMTDLIKVFYSEIEHSKNNGDTLVDIVGELNSIYGTKINYTNFQRQFDRIKKRKAEQIDEEDICELDEDDYAKYFPDDENDSRGENVEAVDRYCELLWRDIQRELINDAYFGWEEL